MVAPLSNRSTRRWGRFFMNRAATLSHVYFPTSSIVSLLRVMENGSPGFS